MGFPIIIWKCAFFEGLEKAAINRIFLILLSLKKERKILLPFYLYIGTCLKKNLSCKPLLWTFVTINFFFVCILVTLVFIERNIIVLYVHVLHCLLQKQIEIYTIFFLGMNVTYFFSKTNKKASSSKWDLPFWISLLPLEFWPHMFKILELKILPTKIPYQPSFLMQWWPYLRLHRKFRRHQLVCFSYQFFVLYCSQVLSNIFSVSF